MKEIRYLVRDDGDGYQCPYSPMVEDLQEPIVLEIFAPDPITGNPASDLHVEFSSTNQNVRDYINAVFRKPLGVVGSADKEGDITLDMLRRGDETRESYIQRLTEIASE